MMQLVYEYNHDEGGDPFLREARFHVRFERVLPSKIGNGRTGRILVKSRSHAQPGLAPVVILVEERAAYMDLLARSDYDGLAAMLRRLSEAETERMERFAEL